MYPEKDLGETLPLTRMKGIWRRFISYVKFGQISDSTKMNMLGLTDPMVFLTNQTKS